VSPAPGRGASLPGAVSGAVPGLVRGKPPGGLHHRLPVGPGAAYDGEAQRELGNAERQHIIEIAIFASAISETQDFFKYGNKMSM